VPSFQIPEDAVYSIQGVSSASSSLPVQTPRPAVQPVAKVSDRDGDIDRAGSMDRDKGRLIDMQA